MTTFARAYASGAVTGRFANAGQARTSSERIIVGDAVWDSFLEKFLRQAVSWQLGDPARAETKLGPMSSVSGRTDLEGQVQDAVAEGATVHLGGSAPDGPGAYYPGGVR